MLEGYTALGFLAGQTERITLGLLVTGVTYRHPGLLAKTVTTLDVLSGGRAMLGIGAAWYEREHLGLGVPYPSMGERFERLEETLQICLQMWSDDEGPYEGKHFRLAETICRPAPLSSPRPKVLIGGSGERKTLRFVARYADACNLFSAGHDEIAHKLDVLARHCETEGRDPAEIERDDPRDGQPARRRRRVPDGHGGLRARRDREGDARAEVRRPAGLVRGIGERVLPRHARAVGCRR